MCVGAGLGMMNATINCLRKPIISSQLSENVACGKRVKEESEFKNYNDN